MSPGVQRMLVAHPGTQYAPRLAAELQRLGALQRFVTGFALPDSGLLGVADRLTPAAISRRWANRRIPDVPSSRLRLFPVLEWRALRKIRRGDSAEKVFHERNAQFQRSIPERWIAEAGGVVGFDTSSWILAERCRRLGRPFFLDQSIGHPRSKERAYALVRERYPEWIEATGPKSEALIEVEALEHEVATRIVAASRFSQRTLLESGVSADKISVIPYGVDLNRFTVDGRDHRGTRPIRFLFVGLVNARKGVPVLLDAWSALGSHPQAELWLVGHATPRARSLSSGRPGVRLLGSRPHHELPALFRQCDVFVFPSFFEGFGLVLLEAMASGMPIIATDATAAPDLIIPGKEGRVIPIGDSAALATAMAWYLEDPERVAMGGWMARRCAERYPWAEYGRSWIRMLAGESREVA